MLVIIHLLRRHHLQWQVHNILEISRFKSAFFEPIGKQRWPLCLNQNGCRVRYIRFSLRTEFDQTWQEASAQCLLQVSLCFSDQSKNKDDHPCRRLWLAEGFSNSPLQWLAERNLTKLDMKQVFNVFYQVSGVRFFFVCFFFLGGGGGGRGVDRNSRKTNMYELSTLRHAVLVMIPQLCGSLQGFALFHINVNTVISISEWIN